MSVKFYIPLLAAWLLLSGCAGKTITGRVVVKGYIPQTYVALKIENRLYYQIVGKLKRVLLAHYQGDTVTLAGHVVREAAGLAMPASFEATRIVAVEERGR